ncbi:ESX-1 ATPase%2C EccCb1 [Mycobacterium tuberculosis]|nr:ESX-1 ATPase%2C EccCb1 [Mycobacterium tuberculosis]
MTAEPEVRTLREVVLDQLGTAESRAYKMWLAPLTNPVPLNELIARDRRQPLRFALGIMDEPRRHLQDVWGVDVSGAGGNIGIGGAPQTGKSTLLQTMVMSAAATHSPRNVQFYCIDLGGGGLIYLENLPHVGGVAKSVRARQGQPGGRRDASRHAATGNHLQGTPSGLDRDVPAAA